MNSDASKANLPLIDLPIIVQGRVVSSTAGGLTYSLRYERCELRLPAMTEAALEEFDHSNKFLLHDISLQDIVNFLQRVGQFWHPSNSNHPLCRAAQEHLAAVMSYDQKMARRELNLINVVTSFGPALYDLVEAELGHRFYLDEWIPRGDAFVHAQPWGNVAHVMVGNVPVSSIMTLVRGILSKNRTLAKLPSRDPVTALYFALSMIEIDPNHPVTRSMTVFYWRRGDELEEKALRRADVMCVWGGGAAVKRCKELARVGVSVLEFGPKTSLALIGKESATSKKVAIDLAHDASIYNQEACFSPQIAFVEGDHEAFVQNLIEAFTTYQRLLPKGHTSIDDHAHVWRARLEARYGGGRVLQSDGTEWTVIVLSDPSEIHEHPLSRCMYVVPVVALENALSYVTPDTQTVVLSPWSRQADLREQLTLRGAAKITEIGLAEWQRIGAPHDLIFPLHGLVRWVSVERGLEYTGKFIQEGPIDTTKYLMMQTDQLEQI